MPLCKGYNVLRVLGVHNNRNRLQGLHPGKNLQSLPAAYGVGVGTTFHFNAVAGF